MKGEERSIVKQGRILRCKQQRRVTFQQKLMVKMFDMVSKVRGWVVEDDLETTRKGRFGALV